MPRQRREFLLTVDVEALRNRAATDHVNALIWGHFKDSSTDHGISEMMSQASLAGVPITFYLDIAERFLYGVAIDDAARSIAQSGHDLQMHIHPEMLPDDFWENRGLPIPSGRRYNYSRDHCHVAMKEMVSSLTQVAGTPPVAYRAGAFQVSSAWLDEAACHGIRVSSNHCYASWLNQRREPVASPEAGPFKWQSGLAELPVTQIRVDGTWRTLAMPMDLPGDPNFRKTLEALARDVTGPPIVFLMHSWSLLKYAGDGKKFHGGAPNKLRRFIRLLESISTLFEPISTTEFAARIDAGVYEPLTTAEYPEQILVA
jgi:hypothetical protein